MFRMLIAHLTAEAIRSAALVLAPDLPPAACLIAGFVAGVLVELWLAHRNDRPPPPTDPAERHGDRTR